MKVFAAAWMFLACGVVQVFGASEKALEAAGVLDFRQVVTDAKDKVFPTVVFIKCVT
jgi:hypothetical protein